MKPNLKVLLLLLSVTAALVAYALLGPDLDSEYAPKKLDLTMLEEPATEEPAATEKIADSTATATLPAEEPAKLSPDTTPQKILFIGDSMLEGLCRRFIDYTEQNGHRLNTVIWYSSSSEIWATTDTLRHYIRKFDPTYIVVCLGSNELFVRDIDKRKKYLKQIVKQIGDIPFVWISPPNWKKDTGINDAIIEAVGRDRYFDSTHLSLERGPDHAHPTYPAAAKWMDLIARWMESDSVRNPIVMKKPTKDLPAKNVIMLKPYNQ